MFLDELTTRRYHFDRRGKSDALFQHFIYQSTDADFAKPVSKDVPARIPNFVEPKSEAFRRATAEQFDDSYKKGGRAE